MISKIEEVIHAQVWAAPIAIAALAGWVWWRRRQFRLAGKGEDFDARVLHLVNLVDGVVGVFATLALAYLADALLAWESGTALANSLQTPAHLLIYLIIAFVFARFVELLWIDRSNFVQDRYIPGLPRALLFGAALLLAVTVFGVGRGLSINGLYISTGAMAALIAFAMQRTLGDLFSGISLSIEHPFKIGDWIELEDGTQGEVRDLNWRATRLRGWDNSTLIIPNGELARQTFKNLHGEQHRYSHWYTVTLSEEIDPRFAKALLLDVALKCKRVMQTPLPSVRLVDSGTVPYKYQVWLHFENYQAMFAGREEFFRGMHYALRDAGVQAAPPSQDVRFQAASAVDAKPPSIQHALRSLDFTSSFNEEELARLIERSYSEIIDAGAVLLAEGDTASSVDIIMSGVVETTVTDAKGAARPVKPLSSGEYFGLGSMLMDTPSFQSFVASTDVTLLRVDRKCFKEIASSRSELLESFAEIVNHRMMMAETVKNEKDQRWGAERIRDIVRRIEKMLG